MAFPQMQQELLHKSFCFMQMTFLSLYTFKCSIVGNKVYFK